MTDTARPAALDNLAHEDRTFPPSAEFAAQANVDASIYAEADADRVAFWGERAKRLEWAEPFTQVLDWSNAPFAKWFVGGKLNVAVNCLDRHVAAGLGDRVAYYFEGEPDGERPHDHLPELTERVCQAANVLEGLGVEAGDRVAIYMPMVPETVDRDARLRAHRRAAHRRVRRVLRGRARDADPGLRRPRRAHRGRRLAKGAAVPLKPVVDKALERLPRRARARVVVKRTGTDVTMVEGRDLWWHDTVDVAERTHEAQAFDAEHPLTCCTPPAPPASRRASCTPRAGYLARLVLDAGEVFDLKPETTCTGAPPTSAGSPATATSSTARSRTRRPRCIYEGAPGRAAPRPLVGDRRALQGVDPVLRADGDPHLHEVGRRDPREARPVHAAAARVRGGADQPGSVDVVPRAHRRRPLPRSSTRGGRPRPAR